MHKIQQIKVLDKLFFCQIFQSEKTSKKYCKKIHFTNVIGFLKKQIY